MSKDKDYNRLIHTVRWLRLRRDKISANPTCERCEGMGRLSPTTEIHHVIPVENGLTLEEKRRLMYDPTNLMALCHDCHVYVHTERGRGGKKGAKSRATEQRDNFRKKFLE